MSTSAESFIRAIRHTNDLILEYSTISPTPEQLEHLYKTLINGCPKKEFYETRLFVQNFMTNEGLGYLFDLLTNWNKVLGIKDECIGELSNILDCILQSPLLISEIIHLKFWRALYDFKWYGVQFIDSTTFCTRDYLIKFSDIETFDDRGEFIYFKKCSNSFRNDCGQFRFIGKKSSSFKNTSVFDYRYEKHFTDYHGIPEYFWNNPLIRPHMLSDPYLKDCIIPLLTSDIPYLRSTSENPDLEVRMDSLVDEISTLKKKTDTLKLLEIIGNLERRIEDLERKDHSTAVSDPIHIPSAPPIDYHRLYLEQQEKIKEFERIISSKEEPSSPFVIKVVIDSMKLEERFWHSLQKKINLDVTARTILINGKQYLAYRDNPIIYNMDNKPVGRLNYDYRSGEIEIISICNALVI